MNDTHAPEHAAELRGLPSAVWRFGQDRRFALLRGLVDVTGGDALDLGCGLGVYTARMAEAGAQAIGTEIEWPRAVEARRRGIDVLAAVGEHLPFPDGTFRAILSHEVLEHVRDDRATAAEAVRTLAPGGRLIVFVPNRLWPFETHGIIWRGRYRFGNIPLVNWLPDALRNRLAPHVRVYTRRSLRALFEAHRDDVDIVHHGCIFPGYDNLAARRPALGRIARAVTYGLERTPLRWFGLSHVIVVERRAIAAGRPPRSRGRARAPDRARATFLVLAAALVPALIAARPHPPHPDARPIAADGPARAVRIASAQEPGLHVHLPLLVRLATPRHATPFAGPAPATPTASSIPGATPTASPTPTATSSTAGPIPSDFAPFGVVRLEPELRLDGSGSVVDSLAFWEAPAAEDTLLLVTAKGNRRVEVWRWPFEGAERPALQDPGFSDGSVVNGIVVDQDLDRVYVSVSRPSSTIAAFALPRLASLGALVAGRVDLRTEPNLALLTLSDGAKRLYASADDRVYAFDPADGAALGSFQTGHAVETLLADDVEHILYIPDETRHGGVFAYRPDGGPFERGGVAHFGGGGIFEADAEGIALYACRGPDGRDDGRGLVIVSDQKIDASDFEFFDRRSWAHLGRLVLNGVRLTDGIASTRQPLPGHPDGLFAAVNDDTEVALVGWDRIVAATGLRCEDGPAVTATPSASLRR